MHSFQVHLVGREVFPTAPKWTWGTYREGTRRAQKRSPSDSEKSEVRVVGSNSEAHLPVSQTRLSPGCLSPLHRA